MTTSLKEQINHPKSLLFLAICAILISTFLYQHGFKYFKTSLIDFPSFYAGAKITFEKQESPYRLELLEDFKKETNDSPVYPYIYPPPSLILFYPLSLMSFPVAKAFALAGNHLCAIALFIFSLRILRARFGIDSLYDKLIFTVFFFMFGPLIETISHGQVNLVITLCLYGVWWLASKPDPTGKDNFWIGGLLTIAFLLKLYPALLLFYFLFNRRIAVILWFGAWVTVFSLMSLLILQPEVWTGWYNLLASMSGHGSAIKFISVGFPFNISLNGFFSRLFTANDWTSPVIALPALSQIFYYLSAGALLFFTFRTSYTQSQHSGRPFSHNEFGLYLFTMFLIAPWSWAHHMVFLLPAIIPLVVTLAKQTVSRVTLIAVVALIIISVDFPYGLEFFYKPSLNWFISIKLFAVVALWFIAYNQINQKAHPIQAT